MPDATLEVVDGAGHQVPLELPDHAVRVVRGHLEHAVRERREAA